MKKTRGSKGGIIGVIFSLVLIGVVLAALQLTGVSTPENALQFAKDKATHYAKCIPAGDCGLLATLEKVDTEANGDGIIVDLPPVGDGITNVDGIDFSKLSVDRETKGYRGPSKGEPYVNNAGLVNKQATNEILIKIKTISDKEDDKKDVGYSRKEWKHWTGTEGKSCWNTREEILHRDAVPDSVKYINKQKQATTNYDEACAIGTPKEEDGKIKIDSTDSGEWICPYNGKKYTNASEIDIDHIIPLSNAARNGGQAWTPEQKEAFANDPDNLLATSAKENRAKGDKGPGKYMPPYKAYRCQYAKSFTFLAHKYGLTITDSDFKELDKTLKTCQY